MFAQKTMCCFVVPLGCEREMDIHNPEKQMSLLEQTGNTRLVIVILGRGHTYESLDKIKEELNPGIVSLVPADCANADSIPYLSSSRVIHLREVVFENAQIAIEDFVQAGADESEEPQVLRQMIFTSKPTQIQSELPLIYRNSKSQGLLPHMKTQSVLRPKKNKKEVIFDRDSLTYECHQACFSGLSLVAEKLCAQLKNAELNKKINILVLGTGVGVLPMFLKQHFSTHLEKITTVEIDAGVLLAARDHFGFNAESDPQIDSINADAYDFVQSLDANQFDMIFIDINEDEGGEGINPPFKFFSPGFLNKLVDVATDEGGLIAMNTIIDGDANRRKVVQNLKAIPGCVKFSSGMQEEVNEVFYLAKGTFDRQAEDKLDETDIRIERMNQIANALKLPKALMLNKQKMQVSYHVEEMRKIF